MQRALKSALILVVPLIFTARPLAADEIVDRVEELTKQATPAVVEIRHDLHAHPELSNREERTGRVIAERLKEIGVDDLQTGVAHHGVVALIRGRKPGPTVALRADMDALPILEQTGLPFASQNPGVMHGCGHDCHVAMLLGAAEVLSEMRDVMPGTVKLIFQPAEEGVPPGEEGGAKLMVEEGVLADPDVAAIFGMHVNTELETGKIAYRFGGLMAAVDRFKVTIKGKQSHAAMPWKSIDPVVTSAHVITAIQTIASRKVDAREAVVVSVGILSAGQAWNIIPEEVVMEGTIRSHDVDVRRLAVREFRRIVEATAAAHGATAEILFDDYGPVVRNDPELGAGAKVSIERAAGKDNVVEAQPVMGGEDFAQYVDKLPGFYIFLGARNEAIGAVHALHTPYMIIDEAALPLGVRAHCLMALDFLQRQSQK
jgi:amidohydrolase